MINPESGVSGGEGVLAPSGEVSTAQPALTEVSPVEIGEDIVSPPPVPVEVVAGPTELEKVPEVQDADVPPDTSVSVPATEPISVPDTSAKPEPAPTEPRVSDAAPVPAPTPAPSVQSESAMSVLMYYLKKANDTTFNRKRKKLERVVAEAKKKGKITNDQVEKLLRVSDSTAQRYLMQLVREGRLRLVGPKERAEYEAI